MQQPIIKVDWVSGLGTFSVVDKVKVVYDTNDSGDLIPVDFMQTDDDEIELINQPAGQVYYRCKKSK